MRSNGGAHQPTTSQPEHSEEERRYLGVVRDYQSETGRKFLSATEYYRIAMKTIHGQGQGDPEINPEVRSEGMMAIKGTT